VTQEGDGLTRRVAVAVVFGLAVVGFGAVFVVGRRHELAEVLAELAWPAVLAALLLAVVAQLAALASYREITADLGSPLPPRPAGKVYFVSQLGKYLPGSVWGMVALVSLAARQQVPRRTSVAAGVINLVVSVATAGALAALLLPFGARDTVRHFWYLALLLPVLLAGLHPQVVVGALDVALRKVGRVPVPSRMSYAGTVRAAGWQTVCWLLYGVHAAVLAVGIGAPASPATVAVAVGGFALAYGIGPLFVLTPAGAGVRETALVLLLGGALDGSAGSTGALALALVSRLLLVVTEFGQAGVWVLLARTGRPTPSREPVPV
jgi:glycosyltransferase 2 family protein